MKKNEEEKILPQEEKVSSEQKDKPMRRIVIETDGNSIHIAESTIAGKLELTAILQGLLNHINQQK